MTAPDFLNSFAYFKKCSLSYDELCTWLLTDSALLTVYFSVTSCSPSYFLFMHFNYSKCLPCCVCCSLFLTVYLIIFLPSISSPLSVLLSSYWKLPHSSIVLTQVQLASTKWSEASSRRHLPSLSSLSLPPAHFHSVSLSCWLGI